MPNKDNTRIISDNRQARHNYFILDSLETGIELFGTEVKSLRASAANLKDAWIDIEHGELILKHMHISPYEKGNIFNRDPVRDRRLLAHKREILSLSNQVKQDGITLIPLSVYFKGSRVKVQLGVCKGKKLYDKRESQAKKEAMRTIERTLKERNQV